MPSDPVRILIVEDDQVIASYMREVLIEAGYSVVGTAGSGNEALVLVAQQLPQLALVDIQLAGPMDGIELACLMRTGFNLPVIFLSGVIGPDTIRRGGAAQLPSQIFNAIELALARIAFEFCSPLPVASRLMR
jgi:CheY-like chemotaxis protein